MSNPQKQSELCPKLWSKLPDDVIALVFEKLPFVELIGLRTLNQDWMTRILSSEFFSWRLDPANTVLLLYVEERLIVYNVKSNSWHQQSLRELLRSSSHVFVDPRLDTCRLVLIASDGGLLCFSTRDYAQVIVCNPVTKQVAYLTLPDISSEKGSVAAGEIQLSSYEEPHIINRIGGQLLVGLRVDPDTGQYKLLTATLHRDTPLQTNIYNSQTKSWKQVHHFPSIIMDLNNSRRLSIDMSSRLCNMKRGCVVCNDSVYSLVQYMDVFWELLKFDLKRERWSVVPLRRRVQFNLQLGVYEGKLLLVETPWWYRYNFFVVLESDGEITSWISVLEPLSQQLENLVSHLPREFRVPCCLSCIGTGGGIIYFLSHDHRCKLFSETTALEANDLKLLVYNLHTKLLMCVDMGKNVKDLKLAESTCCAFRPSLAPVSS